MVHFSMLGVAHNVDAVVIVEHEDVGDDRRRHQDDMRGGRHLASWSDESMVKEVLKDSIYSSNT